MMKALLLGLLMISSAATALAADETKNIAILNNVIEQLERSYTLEWKPGKRPGAFLNPLVCGFGPECRGIVRFRCLNQHGDKKFKVKAVFIYRTAEQQVELKKVVIKAID